MTYYVQYPLNEEDKNIKQLPDNHAFFGEVHEAMCKFGVVVIDGVFTDSQCNRRAQRIVEGFTKINPNIDISNPESPKNWDAHNLPPETRMGLFQHSSAYFPGVLEVRTNKRIKQIFAELYARTPRRRNKDYKREELVYAPDGINVLPPHRVRKIKDDWAHVDQPYFDEDLCYQSTISLSDSSAGFRCTPTSHLIHEWVCNKYGYADGKGKLSSWIKFNPEEYADIREHLNKVASDFNPTMWQVCIPSTRGRLIIWNSALIHSAYPNQLPLGEVKKRFPSQPYLGWRISVYVCYRPLEDFTEAQYTRLIKHIENCRGTNHWGTKVYSKRTQFSPKDGYNEYVEHYIADPKAVLMG